MATYGTPKSKTPRPISQPPLQAYQRLNPYQAQPAPRPQSFSGYGGHPPDERPVQALSTPGANAGARAATTTAAPPTAPNVYDINTDPALQAISALTGKSDSEAQAAALHQRQGQLLGYGDQNLAQATLGDPTLAQAAGANPTSTLKQLGTGYGRNVHDLTESLNKQNLFYGGYRVTQEQQAAQDYQNALAKAAGDVNANLETIGGNLAQTLAGNQMQRIAAMQAAYANAPTQAAVPATGLGAAGLGAQAPDLAGTGAPIVPAIAPTVPVTGAALPPPDSVVGNAAFGGQYGAPAAAASALPPPDSIVGNAAFGGQYAAPAAATLDPNARRLAMALAAPAAGGQLRAV